MDPKKLEEQPIKVYKASNICLSVAYLDPTYSIGASHEANISKTGWLMLFRLDPAMPNLPGFVARWDQKKQTVDVDLIGGRIKRLLFKFGRAGYYGHHPTRVLESPRAFEIDIRLPHLRVCEARLTLNVHWSVSFAANLGEFSATLLPELNNKPKGGGLKTCSHTWAYLTSFLCRISDTICLAGRVLKSSLGRATPHFSPA